MGAARAEATAGRNRTLREGPEGFAEERERARNQTGLSSSADDSQELPRRAGHRVGRRQHVRLPPDQKCSTGPFDKGG
ncbi:hypothetical protein [Streptomyces sp. NPDC015125]|uniref:hypothetical protein n=1 Tax=Streptomyces sp. NPDC015125 TaxID=3364938 RepID=UPI0036FD1F87